MTHSTPRQMIDWERASWQEGCATVEHFTDKLGTPIDPGIFETVVVLNLLGFRTFQSCEGHLDHGCAYPWVTVIDAAVSGRYYQEITSLSKLEEEAQQSGTEDAFFRYLSADTALRLHISRWKEEDLLFRRVREMLDTFYARDGETMRLSATRLHGVLQSPGITRIEPGSALHAKNLPEGLKAAYLARGQAEMQAFTCYLKRRWQARFH